MAAAMGVERRTDPDRLRWWETHRHALPKPATIDLLCRLYQTNARALGLDAAGDYGKPADARNAAGTVSSHPDAADGLCALRRSVDRTLASASVTSTQLDLLEETLLLRRRQYLRNPPHQMLTELTADLREVQQLADERQPASIQQRLSEMTAILATLIADALMKLGELRHSNAWYATARIAADDSGQVELRARVHAQAAMLPYYYGPLGMAIRLTQTARLLVQDRPTPAGAFAASAEARARARARAGDTTGAGHAMNLAREWFERAETAPGDDAWAFPERRFLLYLSGALTALGQTRQAQSVQRQAHALYAKHPGGIDPALLRIEQALCLLRDRHLAEACQLAGDAYLDVPIEHRTHIVRVRVRNLIDAVPRRMRTARPARELGEILALSTS